MNTKFGAACLSILGGALALVLPAVGHAGNVGYFDMCGGNQAAHAAAITIAGHTPVAVTTPDAETLSGLNMLSVTNCSNNGYSANYTSHLGEIAAAVNNGMILIVHDRAVTDASTILAGGSGLTTVRDTNSDIDFPAGSPIITGPGGTLTNASLDGGTSSSHGYIIAASLPAGGSVLASRPSGGGESDFESCDDYGYRGTKLNWCRQICEVEQTPAVLDTWIHRWLRQFHEDPPCMSTQPITTEGATIQYPLGYGRVIYSTIPLDFYLAGSGPGQVNQNMDTVYLPNVISWAFSAQQPK